MKILIGVIVTLALAVAGLWWQLDGTQTERDLAQQALTNTREALSKAEAQNTTLIGRFDSLDTSLKGLGAAQLRNQADLTNRLATIKNIVQEPGDTDESISCLDVRVPAQLDRGLR